MCWKLKSNCCQKNRFLEKLDIFGVEINIKFNQQNKHKTRFGGLVTLVIVGALILLLSSSVEEIIYKLNPSVLSEQKLVSNPSRYNLSKKNFSFVITLLDIAFNPIMDERIYRFEGNFLYKERQVNADGSLGKGVFKNRAIEMSQCTQNDFQVQDTIDYFVNLAYEQMYCVKYLEDLYLQGQFEMEDFSVIEFRAIPCDKDDTNNKAECIDGEVQRDILSKSILQVYYNNQVVQVSNYQQPFKSVGQSYFWESNIDYQQNINLLFQNTYVVDDVGLFSSDTHTRKSLVYSSERTMLSSKEDLSFYKVSLYLEKNKELYYNRTYKRIPEALSKVGGIYNFLFIIGCIIAQPYSQMQLHRKLFNQTFQVAKNTTTQNNMKKINNSMEQCNNTSLDKKVKTSISSSSKTAQISDRSNVNKHEKKIQFSLSNKTQLNKILKQKNHKLEEEVQLRRNSLFNISQQTVMDVKEKKQFKTLAQNFKNQITDFKVKTTEYLSYYFNCFKIFKSDIQDMVSFGTNKIYDYTDICFIVNKLLEIEKLKHLILNEQQIKLFEFIPKPKIDLDIIMQHKKQINSTQDIQRSDTQNYDEDARSQQSHPTNLNLNGEVQISQNGEVQIQQKKEKKRQINILSIQNRSLKEKSQQAQEAFNNIYKNETKKSKVDLKLIQMLDENLVQLFKNNTFDDSLTNSQTNYNTNNIFDTTTQSTHRGYSAHKIKFEKSLFQSTYRQTEDNQTESVYANDEIIERPNRISISEKIEAVKLYENKQKNFITHTELKNTDIKPIQISQEYFRESENLKEMQTPHTIFSQFSQFGQYENSPTTNYGNKSVEIQEK